MSAFFKEDERMKKIITFVFALNVVVFFGGNSLYAQGKGPSFGGGNQGHGPAGGPAIHSDGHSGPKTEKSDVDKQTNKQLTETRKEQEADEKIVEHIDRNPQVKANVQNLLAGMDLKTAAMGFRNQGQFIAALHVSKNLNIPFDQLKSKLTGDHSVSLGKAIQELRPNLTEKQAKDEAEKAEKQARETEKISKATT